MNLAELTLLRNALLEARTAYESLTALNKVNPRRTLFPGLSCCIEQNEKALVLVEAQLAKAVA
jgi:hypothetical protein